MGDVMVSLSMSLDGFVAGPNDEIEPLHDWLFNGDSPVPAEMARDDASFTFVTDGVQSAIA